MLPSKYTFAILTGDYLTDYPTICVNRYVQADRFNKPRFDTRYNIEVKTDRFNNHGSIPKLTVVKAVRLNRLRSTVDTELKLFRHNI